MDSGKHEGVQIVGTEGLGAATITLLNENLTGREQLSPIRKILPIDHPTVADAVVDLEAAFGISEPERKYWEDEQVNIKAKRSEMNRQLTSDKSRGFLQAHMVIIEQLLMNPGMTTTALAAATGYHRQWLHKIMSSDAFQAKLAEKQAALISPIVMEAITDRLKGMVSRSLEILEERLESDKVSIDAALAVFSAGSKAMGMGVAKAPVAQQFIVHMPAPGLGAKDWAAQYATGGAVGEGLGATGESAQTITAASSEEFGDLSTSGAVIREVQGE